MASLEYESRDHYIDGEWVEPASGEYYDILDPATEEVIASIATGSSDDVNLAVEAAEEAFEEWRTLDPAKRGRYLIDIARRLRDRAEEFAELESLNQGKPLRQARNDIEGAARYFEYYGGAADKLEGRSIPVTRDRVNYTVREPYGVSGQIIPWNYPFNLLARGVAPALAAGNTVVAKPAPTTPLTALLLTELCEDVGLPEGVYNVVTGGSEPGAAITEHDDVDVLTFTGSVPTGQAVMEAASRTITPVTLELGGKNSAIVTPDANLKSAVFWTRVGIFINSGQVCSAADRAIVHESVYDEFVEGIVNMAESLEVGPGIDDPDMGPLNHAEHFEKVTRYIDVGLNEGATLATGGEALDRPGYFVEPTVFTDVEPDMRLAREEIFGPVLAVTPYSEPEEAIKLANDVEFGLTGGVFSNDIGEALRMARDLEAGTVYVNEWFGGTVETPFGGFKKSGIGREKGLEALDSYLQTKSVLVNIEDR